MHTRYINTLFLFTFPIIVFSQALEIEWVSEYSCFAPAGLEYDKIIVDEDQNVYLFGAAPSPTASILYGAAILTQKYNSSGNLVWESYLDNMIGDKLQDGAFNGTNSLIVGGIKGALPGSDPGRAEIINYDKGTGEELWRTYIFDTLQVAASLHDIDMDSEGFIYAFGIANNHPEVYDSNKMFVAKILPDNGEIIWSKIFQDEFNATKGRVLDDKIRIYGGKRLSSGTFTNFMMDTDLNGNVITSKNISQINYGPGIFNPYFFFTKNGFLISFGYKVYKHGVSEEPVWSFDFSQSMPNMIGQANSAYVDETGNVYATGYVRDTISLEEYTQTVKLSPDGELIWSKMDNFTEESRLERGNVVAASDYHTFVCATISYYDDEGNPLSDDYRILLYSNGDGSIVYDTLLDLNVRERPYYASYNKGHFYLLGKSYVPSSQDPDDYRYKIFKFSVDEPVSSSEEHKKEYSVNIFPNPTINKLTIFQENKINFNHAVLYDLNGKEMFFKNIENTNQGIDLKGIPAGTYFLKLTGKNEIEFTEKILIGE